MRRREFLGTTALGLIAASGCHPSARTGSPTPDELRGLTRLLEESRREDLLDRVAERMAGGVTYDTVLAALSLAAARHVRTDRELSTPQHILLCLHSIRALRDREPHRASLAALLWAVDHFKAAQAEVQANGSTPMPRIGALPSASAARAELRRGLEELDPERAETAIVAMWRAGQRGPLVQALYRYASRDFREIGHKTIHVANGLATLEVTRWYGAEEVLRSIARTCTLAFDEAGHDVDGAWPRNQALAARIPAGWAEGTTRDEAPAELLAVLRQGTQAEAAEGVVALLARGTSPRSIWDGVLLGVAELLLDDPRAVEALHAVTATVAARTAYDRLTDDGDRRLNLLQSAARVVDFRDYLGYWREKRKRPPRMPVRLQDLEPVAAPLDEIFAEIGPSASAPLVGAGKALALLEATPAQLAAFAARAIDLAAAKTVDDTHDFKLLAAVLEAAPLLATRWRAPFVAACTVRLRGSADPDSPVATRIDATLRRFGLRG